MGKPRGTSQFSFFCRRPQLTITYALEESVKGSHSRVQTASLESALSKHGTLFWPKNAKRKMNLDIDHVGEMKTTFSSSIYMFQSLWILFGVASFQNCMCGKNPTFPILFHQHAESLSTNGEENPY